MLFTDTLTKAPGFYSPGEREEVHAASGQPEGQGRRKGLHVQQAHVCHLQYRAAVSLESWFLVFKDMYSRVILFGPYFFYF